MYVPHVLRVPVHVQPSYLGQTRKCVMYEYMCVGHRMHDVYVPEMYMYGNKELNNSVF